VALRFRKNRDGKPKPRFLMGVHPVPTLVTLGNLLCGFASITLAMQAHNPPTEFFRSGGADCLYWSAVLVFLAMVFDAMDGRVARWTKSASKFGMEMDSLCDVVSFGVAPAVLAKAAIDFTDQTAAFNFPIKDRYVWLMLATYVACAALRLARYNVESESGHRDFFFGIPSPAAAGCVASIIILMTPMLKAHLAKHGLPVEQGPAPYVNWFGAANLDVIIQWILFTLPFLMLCLGVLMVSRVHYLHVGDRLLKGRKSLMHLLILGLGLVLIILQHELVLPLVFNGYLLLGLLNELRFQFLPSHRPKEWLSSLDEGQPLEATANAPAAPSQPLEQAAFPADVKFPGGGAS